ncbi:MAG: hypothetical protein PF569_01510 [Candidatus Woesearchaeota archaeon]|jgi:hypothetical protein|nr:hypothetical protein [Candidatus Woesearchaeota archaeon]
MNIIFRKDKGFATGTNLATSDSILQVYQLDHKHSEGELISKATWEDAIEKDALVTFQFNSANSVRTLIKQLENIEEKLITDGKK